MNNRPLSPHLQIYKIQVTTFFSIMHRITGMFLFFLLILLSWCFILHVYFPELFILKCLNILLSSAVIKLLYIFCFVVFAYHFFNGIRHLLWDMGANLGIIGVSVSALVLALVLFLSSIAFVFKLI